jgi:hypothetical protein
MDDRFDRRELLLHLGDVLGALSEFARTSHTNALAVSRLKEEKSGQQLAFLGGLSPDMTVTEFTQRVASAFSLWPQQLLETELDRNALAAAVRDNLFDGNAAGWDAYLDYIQKKVTWFGKGLPTIEQGDPAESSREALNKANLAQASGAASGAIAPSAEPVVSARKRGWPWPEPAPTS